MDQEFINQLAEKLSKLGTKRPLGFHYAHPFGTVPPDSIQCNGAEYNRSLYSDFFAYATEQGWVKTEAEWQEIASQNNGYCSYYSDGNGSTTFRTPKFAPFMQVAIASGNVGNYHEAGIPNITGTTSAMRKPSGGLPRATGAFNCSNILNSEKLLGGTYASTSNASDNTIETFDASRESSVYGKSATVQPESSEWMICVVVFGVATNVGSTDVSNVMSAVAQVQAEIESIQKVIENITKFAAPDYASAVTIAANTPTTIQSNGLLRYCIDHKATGGKKRKITINDVELTVTTDNYATERGILPVLKGDTVSHNGVDELVFYSARYGV